MRPTAIELGRAIRAAMISISLPATEQGKSNLPPDWPERMAQVCLDSIPETPESLAADAQERALTALGHANWLLTAARLELTYLRGVTRTSETLIKGVIGTDPEIGSTSVRHKDYAALLKATEGLKAWERTKPRFMPTQGGK